MQWEETPDTQLFASEEDMRAHAEESESRSRQQLADLADPDPVVSHRSRETLCWTNGYLDQSLKMVSIHLRNYASTMDDVPIRAWMVRLADDIEADRARAEAGPQS